MRLLSRIASSEIFLFLLPAFFVLHGYIENIEAMSFAEALLLLGEYVLIVLLLFGSSYLFLRSWRKAAIFSFSLLFIHLFFGAIHDNLKRLVPNTFLVQYSFLLSFLLIAVVLIFVFLRRTKRSLGRLAMYLNVVFALLIILELPNYFSATGKQQPTVKLAEATGCDTCEKPDIYLIIADEYADSASLQQIFGFNNSLFQNALRQRGFHIVQNSKSNYNFTPFAMASLFQMNYLTGIKGHNQDLGDKNRCYDLINSAPLWKFFRQQGYAMKNYSTFNIANLPTEAPQNYILIGKDMIVSHTLVSRLNKDLRYHLAVTFKMESEINRITHFIDRCNQLLLSRLLAETTTTSPQPMFVYTHLTMPHYPYYFRKDGQRNPVHVLLEGEQVRKKEYLEYLQYSNALFLETIDKILKGSKRPPIILFMGDHGFREFGEGFEKNAPFYYMNLNAVLLPSGNYQEFYNGISSVNQFRALLNASFGQKLPYLKDSTILLYE